MKTHQLTTYTVPQGVTATKTALSLPEDMTGDDWAKLGQYLRAATDSLELWQADWLKFGKAHYEPEFVSSVIGQLEFPLHSVERFELLGAVLPEHRPASVTKEHILVAGKRCRDDKEREVWLNTAAIEGLTPRELQASIRAHEVVRIEMDKRRVSMPSPYAVVAEFNAWRREMGEADKGLPVEDLADIVETLRPIAEYVAGVERMIGRRRE